MSANELTQILAANPLFQLATIAEFQQATVGLVLAEPTDMLALPVDSFVFSCEHVTDKAPEGEGSPFTTLFRACDGDSPQWGNTLVFPRDAMYPPHLLGSYAYGRGSQISRAARRISTQALEWTNAKRMATMAFTAPMGTKSRDDGGRTLSAHHAALAMMGGLFTFLDENPTRFVCNILVSVPNRDHFDAFDSVLMAYLFVSSYDPGQHTLAVAQASKRLCNDIRQFVRDHPEIPEKQRSDIMAKTNAFSATIPEQGGKVGAKEVARWIRERRAVERWNELLNFAMEKLSSYGFEPSAYTVVDTIIRLRADKILAEKREEEDLQLRGTLLLRLIGTGPEAFLREHGIDPETDKVKLTNARLLAMAGAATRADMDQVRAMLENPTGNSFDRGLVVIATARFQNMIAMFFMGRSQDISSFNAALSNDDDHRALMRDMQQYIDGIGGRDLAPYVLADTGIQRGEKYIDTLESTLRDLQRLLGEISARTLELARRGKPI